MDEGTKLGLKVPEFIARREETMSPMEYEAIKERTHGMTVEQKRVTLQYMPSELIFEELGRRDLKAKHIVSDLRDKLHDIRSNMSLDEMRELIGEVQEIIRKDGEIYGQEV